MTIGIISAMTEENASLVDAMMIYNTDEIASRLYVQGVLWGQEVVVVFSRWGKVAAASTAVILIEKYNVDEVIFTGVAGSIDRNVAVGDIVIGRCFYQHDLDVRPILPRHELPLLGVTRRQQLHKAAACFLSTQLNSQLSAEEISSFKLHNPKVVDAAIASGDQFISSAAAATELKERLPDVACVEMEGGAVAQICYEYAIPFSVIRTISDSANDSAAIDFEHFVRAVARKYALGILENLFAP